MMVCSAFRSLTEGATLICAMAAVGLPPLINAITLLAQSFARAMSFTCFPLSRRLYTVARRGIGYHHP